VIEALLDTHVLLWTLAGSTEVPGSLARRIDAAPSAFGVSDASIWEIAIKRSTGKLTVADDLPQIISSLGLSRVPITRRQAWAVRDLPFHHRDPFDRLLIAQAVDLQLPLISADGRFTAYGVATGWPAA